jgi:hypothetical protein
MNFEKLLYFTSVSNELYSLTSGIQFPSEALVLSYHHVHNSSEALKLLHLMDAEGQLSADESNRTVTLTCSVCLYFWD